MERRLCWTMIATLMAVYIILSTSTLLDAANPIPTAKPGEKILTIAVIINERDSVLGTKMSKYASEQNDIQTRNFFLRLIVLHTHPNDSTRIQIDMCNLLEKDRSVVAIILHGSQLVASNLYEFARTLKVPVFATNIRPPIDNVWAVLAAQKATAYPTWHAIPKGSHSRNGSFLFTLMPDTHRALADILVHYHVKNFSYICNSEDGLRRMEAVIQRIHNQQDYIDLNIDVRYVKNTAFAIDDLRHLDRYLRRFKRKSIILDLETVENVIQVFRQLGQLGMMRDDYHYFLTVMKARRIPLKNFIYSGVNVTGFSLSGSRLSMASSSKLLSPDVEKELKRGYMMDATKSITRALKQILADPTTKTMLDAKIAPMPECYYRDRSDSSKTNVYRSKLGPNAEGKVYWLGTLIANVVSSIRFQGDTGQVAFDDSGRRDNYSLTILEMEYRSGLKERGKWNTHDGLLLNYDPVKKDTQQPLIKNKTYNVVTILSPPFVMLKVSKSGKILTGNDRFEGFCVDLVREIADLIKFDYEIKLVDDGKYGAQVSSGNSSNTTVWNGMIGELLNGTADIAVAPLTINSNRARVVKFSEPFLTFGISLMIRKPGKKKPGIFSFLRPLSNNVWLCISTACFVVACGLYIIARISPYEWTVLEDTVERDFTFMNSVWFSFSAFVQQGVDVAPRSPGARILSSVWWFFTLIMIAYYTANLAAFLTVSRIVKPINDWVDLTRDGIGIEYGTVDSGSTKDFFLKTKLSPFNEMGNYMRRNKHVFAKTTAEGVKRVRQRKGKYAFIMESRMNEFYNQRQPCDTIMAATPFGDSGYGVATRKDSPLREEINNAVLRLRELQKLAESYKRWWIEKGECHVENEKSNSKALALINVAGAFYILVAGLGLALFTALLEFYCVVRREYRRSMSSFPDMVRRKARMSMAGEEMELPGRQDYECGRYGLSPVARTINLI